MPDWIAAGAGLGGAVVALIAFIWGRVDIYKERAAREESEARSQAMANSMDRMTRAVETMADTTSTPAQVEAASAQARNSIRWRIRQVDRSSNRVVYELVNAGDGIATGVSASAPEGYNAANMLHKLPVDATVHPHEGVRFYLIMRMSVVPMASMQVRWDGGDEMVPVTDL